MKTSTQVHIAPDFTGSVHPGISRDGRARVAVAVYLVGSNKMTMEDFLEAKLG